MIGNGGGVSLFGRPVSRDIFVFEDLAALAGERELIARPGAAALFSGVRARLTLLPDPEKAEIPDAFVLFDAAVPADLGRFDRVTLYRWNRDYPADVFFDEKALTAGFTKTETSEFPGNSHPRVTREIYERV